MEQKELHNFLYFVTRSKQLSREQQQTRDALLTKSFVGETIKPIKDNKERKHLPKDTASFLSLFNQREGLKYLTHNYDNNSTNLKEVITKARKIFSDNRQKFTLPGSLVALVNNFLNGQEWLDYDGNKCSDGYGNPQWSEWSAQNGGKHPITDINGMEQVIQRFRHTIRVVAPDMARIIEQIAKDFPSLQVSLQNIDKADFYTNVFIIKSCLKEIFRDLNDHISTGSQNILIRYIPDICESYFVHKLIITQLGSYSAKSIGPVLQKFDSTGGFFYENALNLTGYCNWSVESLWGNESIRWNILDDTGVDRIETINTDAVKGFTHILTFYQKD